MPRSDRDDRCEPTAIIRTSGPGLSASPAGTLATNTPRYVDYLDDAGRWVGNDTTPPADCGIRPPMGGAAASGRSRSARLFCKCWSQPLVTIGARGAWTGPTGSEALLLGAYRHEKVGK